MNHNGHIERLTEETIDIEFLDSLPGAIEDVPAEREPQSDASIPHLNCYRFITKTEMEQVRQDISSTTRPRWQSGPPTTLGTKGAGKLNADQWRTCIEYVGEAMV